MTPKYEQLVQRLRAALPEGVALSVTVRGTETETLALVQRLHPLFCETLPITLEELFISEMEVAGYDINKVI